VSYSSDVVASAPTRYWRLRETAGTTVPDTAGGGAGTLAGTFAWGKSGPIVLEATNGGLELNPDGRFTLTRVAMSGHQSRVAWIRTSTATGGTTGYDGDPALTVMGDTSGTVWDNCGIHGGKVQYRRFNNSVWQTFTGATTVSDGAWHLIAVTYNSTTREVRLYVDGVLDGSGTMTAHQNQGGVNVVGRGFAADYFKGDLAELELHVGAVLSDAAILSRYTTAMAAGGGVTHFASVSFSAAATLAPTATFRRNAAVGYTASADIDVSATLAKAWAKVRFSARALFVPVVRPRGKKRRTIVTTLDGSPLGEIENARHGAIVKELNRPDEWTFAAGITDPKAGLVLDERIREAQLWRGDRLLTWGPMVRPGADKAVLAVSGKGALWHLSRRNIGKADRTNYVPNGDFEDGPGGWSVSWTSPIEPAAGRNPAHWNEGVSSARALTGDRSLFLEQKASDAPKYGVSAATYFFWETDGTLSPDGDRWTLVAYCFIPSAQWRGPNRERWGIWLARYSTTETVLIGSEDGAFPPIAYPAPIEAQYAAVDDFTPRDQWVKLSVSMEQEPRGEPELVQVTLHAPDGAIYWDRVSLTLEESTKFYGTDQALIAKGIVEHLQDPDFDKSDVRIGTDTPLTGVIRDRVYVHSEHPNGFGALEEFAALDDGFDFSVEVTPEHRTFRTYFPMKGTYRPKLELALDRNLADFAWSFDGEAAASSVIILGQGTGSGREEGLAIDPEAFAGGLTLEEVFAAPPETPIDSLDNYAAEHLASVVAPEVLAVKTLPNREELLGVLDVGDTVPVRIVRGALSIVGTYRIGRLALNPDDTLDLVLNRRELVL
jgi:hypothetical protein